MLQLKKLFYLLILMNVMVVMLYMYVFRVENAPLSHKRASSVTDIIRLDNSTNEQFYQMVRQKKKVRQ